MKEGYLLAKILFITSRFPFPIDKGDKLRVYFQLKSLALHDEVHLVTLSMKPPGKAGIKELEKYCASVNNFVLPMYKRIFSLLTFIWKNLPFQVLFFFNPRIKKKVKNLIDTINPDFIHVHLIRSIEYIKGIEGIEKTLDYMDGFALGMEKRYLIEKNPFRRILFHYEMRRLYKYESLAFEYADRHCIISKQDALSFAHVKKDKIKVVKNGVDFDAFYPREDVKKYDLVFMGVMDYPPNVEAVTFLVKEIMPYVYKERPGCTLLIAGINPVNEIKKFRSENVYVQDSFSHISDSIAWSKVMVAPMLISIGLQNKIIQAMAMKVPCITSPSSNKAIGAKNGFEILEAVSAEEYSIQILTLLEDEAKQKSIAEKGYEFVRSEYSWNLQNKKLRRLIHGKL